jgi:hypothetical protein
LLVRFGLKTGKRTNIKQEVGLWGAVIGLKAATPTIEKVGMERIPAGIY